VHVEPIAAKDRPQSLPADPGFLGLAELEALLAASPAAVMSAGEGDDRSDPRAPTDHAL
jgi:hypothetical protein